MNTPLLAAARLGFIALFGAGILAAQTAPKPEEKKDTTEPAKLEKFEVTGSRIKRTDVEGPSPIHVITREDIDVTGKTSLTDLLRDIPEASSIGINEGGTTTAVRGATALDLRNLGPNNTLVIVNGRRVAPNGINSAGTVFVDLNRYPTAMIDRIEVLKDGASAIYGADATAGVVNIILRHDFNGGEIGASYGNSFKSDTAEQSYSVIGGASSGKARATLAFTMSTRNALHSQDRAFSKNADLTDAYNALDAAKYASITTRGASSSAVDLRSTTGPYATVGLPTAAQLAANGLTTAAIINPLTGTASTFLPGTGGVAAGAIGSSAAFASVPFATANSGRPTAAQFIPRSFVAGPLSNLYNFQEFVWLTPTADRRGIQASFEYDLTRNAVFYSQVSYQRNDSETHLAPSPISTAGDNNIIVPASNYYNPFGIPVSFTYRPIEVGPRIATILSNSYGLLTAVKGTFDRFDYDVGFSYSYNDSIDTSHNALSESRVKAMLARTDATALNIFGGPNFKNNQATIDAMKVDSYKSGNATTITFDARISTDRLFSLPTGKVGFAASAENRIEKFNVANDALSTSLDDIIGQVRLADPTKAKRDVQSVGAEFRVPLLPEGRYRFAHTVELSTAGRYEQFSDGYNSKIRGFFGLRYRPFKDLLLRGSYGENFRAPTLTQLYSGETQSLPNNLADLRRPTTLTGDPFDGSATQRLVKAGGNPSLKPEIARTKQAGFVFDLPWSKVKGLSLDFTYGEIMQNNIITTTGTSFIRQNEVDGGTADLVVRDPQSETYTNKTTANINILSGPNNTTTPVAPGQTVTVPGRIQYIRDSYVNLAQQIVKYSDYGIRYSKRTVDFGRFVATSNWTYLEYYASRRQTILALNNVAGRPVLPRWRGQSSLGWQRKDFGANLSWTYIHRYGDMNRDGYEVKRYSTFGASVSYRFDAETLGGMLKNTRINVGVDNLFDRNPPLSYNGGGVGFDQGVISRPQGRFGFMNLRRAF